MTIVACGDPLLEADGSRSRPAVFFDRDGVLNVDDGYVVTPDPSKIMPGAFEAVRLANREGYAVVIVTNQSGVARGYFAESDVRAYLRWMEAQFRGAGAVIDAAYYCPHLPEGAVEPYRRDCDGRKPKPGMILRAMAEFDIDPSRSVLIGDSSTDLMAAEAAGVSSALFRGGDLAEFLQALL